MKYIFLFFISLLTILTLQYNQNISTNKHDNREMLRDYFLYACINHGFKEFHLVEKDHSGAVYLELLKYDLEALNKVDSLAKTFVQSIPVSNYENKKTKGIIILSIREYNSKKVKSFIKSLDRYMID